MVAEAPVQDATDTEQDEFDRAVAALDPPEDEQAALFTFEVGGKKPTSTSLRMSGGKIDSDEEYEKGDLLRITYEVRVGELAFIDKQDSKTGQVVACERKHVLKPIAPPVVERLR